MREYAAQAIERASSFHDLAGVYQDFLQGQMFDPSFVNNLKDALCHFRRLNSAYNAAQSGDAESAIEVLLQFEYITEHLTRGLTDTFVNTLQNINTLYRTILELVEYETKNGRMFNTETICRIIDKRTAGFSRSILALRKSEWGRITKLYKDGRNLNSRYFSKIKVILADLQGSFEEDTNHLWVTPEMIEIYWVAVSAIEKNADILPIQKTSRYTLITIARNYDCTVKTLKKYNPKLINVNENDQLIGKAKWIIHPRKIEGREEVA